MMILDQEEKSNVKCINRLDESPLSFLECMNIKTVRFLHGLTLRRKKQE